MGGQFEVVATLHVGFRDNLQPLRANVRGEIFDQRFVPRVIEPEVSRIHVCFHFALVGRYAQGLEQLISPDLREEISLGVVISGDEIDPLLVGIQSE